MSLDGVMDAPDLVREAQPYFQLESVTGYQRRRLFAADALLLGRRTYEELSRAYLEMAESGEGAPMDFVVRMNSIPKYVASTTLNETSWNAAVIQGDLVEEVRRIKEPPGGDIVKYGTGVLDRVLFGHRLVDRLCVVLYPFVLGHGRHLFEGLQMTQHMGLAEMHRLEDGILVLEYVPA